MALRRYSPSELIREINVTRDKAKQKLQKGHIYNFLGDVTDKYILCKSSK
jgi:hypothetical protein